MSGATQVNDRESAVTQAQWKIRVMVVPEIIWSASVHGIAHILDGGFPDAFIWMVYTGDSAHGVGFFGGPHPPTPSPKERGSR